MVFSAKCDQIFLAHKRFATGIDIKIYAQFLALHDDGIDLIKCQVQFVAILCRPTTGTF